MPFREINIKKSTYERLVSLKREKESFNDLLNRLVRGKRAKYSDLAGILSEETVDAIEEIKMAGKEIDKEKMRRAVDNLGQE